MAGHSKWANIRHRKARQDAKRGKLFTKVIREITVAARQGGASTDENAALRNVVDKALALNMPRDTIDRAIQRGAGAGDADNLEAVVYEGYAPGGAAIYIETLTDNRNRTVAEIRHLFNRSGGNLATNGAVAYLFVRQGQLIFAPDCDGDTVLETAIEAGALDVQQHEDGSLEVITEVADYEAVRAALDAKQQRSEMTMLTLLPTTTVTVKNGERIAQLIDMLEDLDDVQQVYTNAEWDTDEAG